MTVHIVTDSTADLPGKVIKEFGIKVVPLNIHFGDEVLKDGEDIWSEEFYNRLRNEDLLPNTSQPAPGEFLKVYQQIAKPGDTIISLHISKEMSGTARSAELAAEMLEKDIQVHVIDSRNVSAGLGLIALKAARLAINGALPALIMENIEKWKEQVGVYFTVNSLEYLHRTGRIGKASSLLGGLLNIKPILAIEKGIIVPVEKIRGHFQKVASQIVNHLVERFGSQPLLICFLHTDLPELGLILQKTAESRLVIAESFTNTIGPIVGSHGGPYTLGIVALPSQ
ncbi:DegV family protein with EDD domain [Hydrogenispora ethanolica]|jgi:DegV family protein with EDD domain|uniref:DegV family protein with EDD domain n=1 Tax=Hydrogenispora ethanolica TaxID=1082276 RepID=A0A4R1RSP9_HYDET|nr:DegV family protein [Hydrogenispora ethanolica]TCL69349.1 DegV family protein with EDD domain [Hydrogenispora ethanolica]